MSKIRMSILCKHYVIYRDDDILVKVCNGSQDAYVKKIRRFGIPTKFKTKDKLGVLKGTIWTYKNYKLYIFE